MTKTATAQILFLFATLLVTETFAGEKTENMSVSGSKRVLRHVVLVKFKDSVTPENLQQLENGFRTLPNKIDTIIDFEWGKDVSVEGLAQGFTHCFRVTFQDDKGRAAYLPHPKHAKFVDEVKPNIEKVLVVDYWADLTEQAVAQQKDPKRVLRHVVLFKYKETSADKDIAKIKTAFEALPGKVELIQDFECGNDVSVEGLADGFQHCFVVTFKCEDARAAYLPHPEHKAFVAQLKPHLDKVTVVDYWAGK
jgi:hypothetical protein